MYITGVVPDKHHCSDRINKIRTVLPAADALATRFEKLLKIDRLARTCWWAVPRERSRDRTMHGTLGEVTSLDVVVTSEVLQGHTADAVDSLGRHAWVCRKKAAPTWTPDEHDFVFRGTKNIHITRTVGKPVN